MYVTKSRLQEFVVQNPNLGNQTGTHSSFFSMSDIMLLADENEEVVEEVVDNNDAPFEDNILTDEEFYNIQSNYNTNLNDVYDLIFDNLDYLYYAHLNTDNIVTNKLLTTRDLGTIFRNSLFAESQKDNIPLKSLLPRDLCSYGYINFETDENDFVVRYINCDIDENNHFLVNLVGYNKTNLSHLIIHVFERERYKNGYQLEKIDYVIEITENEEIKCEPNVITSFSYKIEYNTLYLDIVGDFDFKLEIKPSDYVTNEEDEMSAQLQVDLTNRTIVYIESEINPDFKDYVDNLSHGNGSFEEFKQIEDRLKILENKTSNIESSITPEISTELSIENLLKSYDERIKVLENKCANIQ